MRLSGNRYVGSNPTLSAENKSRSGFAGSWIFLCLEVDQGMHDVFRLLI